MQTGDIKQVLCKHGWLADQPADFQQCVLDNSIIRSCYNGEFIYAIGDPPSGVHGMVEGLAKVSFQTPDGSEQLMKIIRPGDWFGMISLLDKLPLPHHARISGKATVLTLPRGAFEEIVSEQPKYLRYFTLIVAHNMREAMERLADIGTLSPAQRLAKLLLNVCLNGAEVGNNEPPEIELSQSEMCSLIAASRATVNKLIREWEKEGWIHYHYRKFRLLEPRALSALIAT